jgi:putative SOS response-associated peptidase YedK
MDPNSQGIGALRNMLLPYDPGLMKAYPVSNLVNSVSNKGPEVIAPIG